jgi:uncharacterized protein YegL/tellurite resistance protein
VNFIDFFIEPAKYGQRQAVHPSRAIMIRKLPVYLLLDTSGSMKGEPIESLRTGLRTLISSLRRNPHALESVHLSVITFDRVVRELCPLTPLEDFQEPEIVCPDSGPTHLGEALRVLGQAVRRDSHSAPAGTRRDWRPILMVMTDGSPSDTQLFEESVFALRQWNFASIIACAAGPKARREPLEKFAHHVVSLDQMDGAAFSSFFQWVSSTIAAGSANPADLTALQSSTAASFTASLEDLLAKAETERGFAIATAGTLAAMLGFPPAGELSDSQAAHLASALRSAGYDLAPAPALTRLSLDWRQAVAVFPHDAEGEATSDKLSGLLRFLFLAMAVASAKGALDENELEIFHRAVEASGASAGDFRHLRATEAALCRDPGVAVLAAPRMAESIRAEARAPMLRTLLRLSAADGEISQHELEMLRCIAQSFQLPSSFVDDWIRKNTASAEVTVQWSDNQKPRVPGEAIPPPAEQASPVKLQPPTLQLDMARVRALTQETREVVAILAEVMNGDLPARPAGNLSAPSPFPVPALPPIPPAPPVVPSWFTGLPVRYHTAALVLIRQDLLSLDQFQATARASHLLPDDLLTSMNSWSDEYLGDFLLEQAGDGVRVFRSLLPAA